MSVKDKPVVFSNGKPLVVKVWALHFGIPAGNKCSVHNGKEGFAYDVYHCPYRTAVSSNEKGERVVVCTLFNDCVQRFTDEPVPFEFPIKCVQCVQAEAKSKE